MRVLLGFTLALVALPALAQHDMSQMHDMSSMQSTDHATELLMQQGSGTATGPTAAPQHMGAMTERDGWMLMAHGSAFVSQVVQSGPRGDDALFSTNWVMGMATGKVGAGQLLLRSMLSLEPLTAPKGGYPELFQTGETYRGLPIVDAQHPHNAFMELAAEYAIPLGDNRVGYLYAAPVGDPALGPVAYPHRLSARELPQATLTHHLQDSTHIADSVVTAGTRGGPFGIEVSGFHGAEPGENRWKIGSGAIDSWSARATWNPTPNWSAQISTGHLVHPEAIENGNVQRTTASATYFKAQKDGDLAASLIWGHNHKSDHDTNGITAEGDLRFATVNYVTGRVEVVDKDELGVGHLISTVKALTAGYTRDVLRTSTLLGGIGSNMTYYAIPGSLKQFYGRPWSVYGFVRVRIE
jgi:hypothetical protein